MSFCFLKWRLSRLRWDNTLNQETENSPKQADRKSIIYTYSSDFYNDFAHDNSDHLLLVALIRYSEA